MIKLRLVHPRIGERIVELSNGALTVGREGARIDLALEWDPRISRRHARFVEENGAVYVEDLGSKNGTWDRGRRIEGRHRLEAGDPVIVGETAFLIEREVAVVPAALEEMMAAYVAGTDDLPRVEPELPRAYSPPVIVEAPASAEHMRSHPRFLAERKVGVRVDERSELKTLWTEDISKGGLFVRTDTPPPRGAMVEVVISTPHGEVALKAEVVHVLDRATSATVGHPPGVGLAFIDVRPEHKKAISDYVDGLADRLISDDIPRGQEAERPSIDNAITRARELIKKAEANDLYGALGCEPDSNPAEINLIVQSLRQLFTSGKTSATPPQLARLNAALKILDRTATLMTSQARRLEYDFRRGETRAEERLEQARLKNGPSATELRTAWSKAFPERMERAMGLAKTAFEMKKSRDLLGAVRHGRQALELDPFHEELRQTLKAWTEMLNPPKA